MPVPSTHARYGGGPADFVGDGASGDPLIIRGGAVLTVWSARSGGVQVTDLRNTSEDTVSVVTADGFGTFEFFADRGFGTVWVATEVGGRRYPVHLSDVGAQLVAAVADLEGVRSVAEGARASAESALAGSGGAGGPGRAEFFVAADDAAAADAPVETFILIRRAV